MITLINITQLYPDLFDGITVPDGMDASLLVDGIMEKYGTLTPVYPEPELFHAMIISFFKRREWNYQKLFDTLSFDYNPLENLNREDITTHTENESENTTDNLTENNTTTTNTDENGTTDNSISAFNTNDYSNDSKQETDYNSTLETETNNNSNRNNDRKKGIEYTHTTSSHGTIGVITNQDMIEKERAVSKFNIYDYIADDFQAEFLIGLW